MVMRGSNTKVLATTKAARRRGVAMFLVIVALGVGVVLSGSMLTRQEPSPAIARNAADAASSEWSAHAAGEYAHALLETSVNWADVLDSGVMLGEFPIAGGTARVELRRLDGSPATGGERELVMVVTSTVGRMTTTVEKRVSRVVPQTVETTIDPHLNEFAIFATGSVDIDDGAVVGTWQRSPEAGTLVPIKLGIGFSGAANFQVRPNALLTNVGFYPDARSSLADLSKDKRFTEYNKLPLAVPAVVEVEPPSFASLGVGSASDRLIEGASQSATLAAGRHRALEVRNAVATLNAGATPAMYSFEQLKLTDRGVLRIVGDVTLLVSGPTSMANMAAIELASGATLRMYFKGDVTLDNSGIGVPAAVAADSARDPDLVTDYRHPDALQLIALRPNVNAAGGGLVRLSNNSVLLGSVHAPESELEMSGQSTLIGRATGRDVEIQSGSRFFACPELDPRTGYTQTSGPLYTTTKQVAPAVATVLAAVTATTTDAKRVAQDVRGALASGASKNNWSIDDDDLDDDGIDDAVDDVIGGVVEGVGGVVEGAVGGLLGGGKGGGKGGSPVVVVDSTTTGVGRVDGRAASRPRAIRVAEMESE